MIFTYEVNLLCNQAKTDTAGCAVLTVGEVAPNAEEGRKNALAQATSEGWLQIGDEVWCPACAARRPQVAEVERIRGGQFCPVTGMRLRFAFPQAGAVGHQMAAAECLTAGKVYTVATVLPNYGGFVMVRLQEVPALFFNVVLFEEE